MATTQADSDRDAFQNDPFSANLPAIQRAIAVVARRRRLSPEDAEDFAGAAMLRLLENDRAILRKFEGRSSLNTFLVTTITRLLLDYRITQWGKWRPSAEARRLGRVALLLEQVVSRDGWSLVEAAEMLRVNYGVTAPPAELEALQARLPIRRPRRMVSECALDDVSAQVEPPDMTLLRPHAARTVKALGRTVAGLKVEERSLIQLRFSEGRSVADIARLQHVDQKALYRTFRSLLARLRCELERQGIVGGDVFDWLGLIDRPASAALRPSPARARAHRLPSNPQGSMRPLASAVLAVDQGETSVA